ncbi:putative phage tail protein [Bacillus sp. FJAT-45350]|uniref:putative phage tail protein n=1 Tax=Bacillus sp. FJAT-45350 TaxID=2011014 RepID=UPI000BB98CE2|nr:putative phage tail protein [Bacillus sp. FJAT-45350]
MSKAKEDLFSLISPFHRNKLMEMVFAGTGKKLDVLEVVFEDIFNQLNVETATWGLPLWEEEYDLKPSPGDIYATRRRRILVAKSTHGLNPHQLKGIFNRFLSKKTASLKRDTKEKILYAILPLGHILSLEQLIKEAKDVIPSTNELRVVPSTSSMIMVSDRVVLTRKKYVTVDEFYVGMPVLKSSRDVVL